MKNSQIALGIVLALILGRTPLASELEYDMTTIQSGNPINGQRDLALSPLQDMKKTNPERWESLKRAKPVELTASEQAGQIALQRAVPAHTVYRVNDKVVAIHQSNGWTTTSNSAAGVRDIPGVGEAEAIGRQRGLKGDALNDFVADRITENLKRQYGAALKVETYDDPTTAPTTGQIKDEMLGIDPQRSSVEGLSSRVALNTVNWAQLLEQHR